MAFFEVLYDQSDRAKWHLEVPPEKEDGNWKDVWAYTRCEWIADPQPVEANAWKAGHTVDYNFASFNIPIVSGRLGALLESIAGKEIQRIPVAVDAPGTWEVLNVLDLVDCLDHERSLIQYYPTDPTDPSVRLHLHKLGQPRGVLQLVIHEEPALGHHIFRIKDWDVAVIISGEVRDMFVAAGVTGIHYTQVSWPPEL